MSRASIQAALDAILSAYTKGGDINTEGVIYVPSLGRPYISSGISAYSRVPAGVGANAYAAVEGTYLLRVMRPSGEGYTPAGALAADLANRIFKRGTSAVTSDGFSLVVMSSSEQPLYLAGDWIAAPVTVNFFHSEP
jgi:hypothetical protein